MKTKRIRQKGITLIALVITIIVLLILAGVSIATLTGQNGLLTKAQTAGEETEIEGLEEEIKLAVQSSKISDYSDDKTTLKEELEKIQGATVNEVEEGIYTVEREENGYTVYEDGTIEEGKLDKWDGVTKEAPEVDGEGNWHIYTASQMKFFADYCNDVLTEEEKTEANMPELTEATTVYLENNMDMGARQKDGVLTTDSETQWTPVVLSYATFDGKNHSISGIFVKDEDGQYRNGAGLFAGTFAGATIKNTSIKNSYIKGNMDFENFDVRGVGGITGFASGDIINCHNINTKVVSKGGIAGGIVGTSLEINIRQCSNSGEVIAETSINAGGIIGLLGILGGKNLEIEDCINTGLIQGKSNYVGGISGSAQAAIKGCKNTGTIIGEGKFVGGVAGSVQTIENSTNSGKVTGTQYTGGVVGAVTKIDTSTNSGKISGTQDSGGIAGNVSTIATNCHNTGEVIGENYNIGGIAGITGGSVENCDNTGKINAEGQVGGILGQIAMDSESNIRNCYNEGEVIANTDAAGGIVGWTSQTGTTGTIEYNYNKGKVRGKNQIGGIIGRSAETFVVTKCYNVGEIAGETKLGSVIGEQLTNNDNLSNLFYWNGLSYKGVNGVDLEEKHVKGVENKIESYEEFKNIIDSLT